MKSKNNHVVYVRGIKPMNHLKLEMILVSYIKHRISLTVLTQTVVTEYANEALKESGCDICQCDDAMIVDWDEDTVCTVEEFANIFWDKAVEGILNVLKTQE